MHGRQILPCVILPISLSQVDFTAVYQGVYIFSRHKVHSGAPTGNIYIIRSVKWWMTWLLAMHLQSAGRIGLLTYMLSAVHDHELNITITYLRHGPAPQWARNTSPWHTKTECSGQHTFCLLQICKTMIENSVSIREKCAPNAGYWGSLTQSGKFGRTNSNSSHRSFQRSIPPVLISGFCSTSSWEQCSPHGHWWTVH